MIPRDRPATTVDAAKVGAKSVLILGRGFRAGEVITLGRGAEALLELRRSEMLPLTA